MTVSEMQSARSPGNSRDRSHFVRRLGVRSGIAINMTQMIGIGPFITIPIMVATFGGPQAIFGWIIGAALAVADGLVWSELGAAMPGAGGTYIYLREAFQYRTGKLMPFIFIWTAMLIIPLGMASGIIGMVQYMGYFFPHLGSWEVHLIAVGTTALIVFALWRKIESIQVITTGLWVISVISLLGLIVASLTHFHPGLAFAFPRGVFGGGFFVGLGAGLIIGIYDYGGYNTTAYMGDELAKPGRVMPRSILGAIVIVMVFYLVMNIGVLGVVPWQQVAKSSSIASLVYNRTWGGQAADVFTVLILITAVASVFAGLLGGSRVPYHAARDRVFFSVFSRMHPRHGFPWVALVVMGVITAAGTFLTLTTVINMLGAVAVFVQSIAQIFALSVLRRRQPGLRRPYRQWLYPLPSLAALAGWLYVYRSAGTTAQVLSSAWIVGGLFAFLIWARIQHFWPFGAKKVTEVYLDAQSQQQQA